MDGVFMSKEDQLRYRIIMEFLAKKILRREAGEKLGLSQRQVTRLAGRVRQKDAAGVKHGNYGRSPVNRHSRELIDQYVSKYREKYADFNRLHALEMMKLHEEFPRQIGYWAFNKACGAAGLGKHRRRSRRPRKHRDRHPREGFMMQLDGSPHLWFDEKESCLISLIDDATSKVPAEEFYPTETTWGCLNVTRKGIEKEGIPEFMLTDLAGWSTGSLKRANFSQYVRACEELDIKVIGTPSAESKGRVERHFRTAQDRLIPELKHFGIKSMLDANRYLEQCYTPSENEKRSVEARDPTRAYRPVPAGVDLREVFCLKYERTVNRDHTIAYNACRYRIEPPNGANLWRHKIVVHEYEDRSFRVFYAGQPLKFEKITEPRRAMMRLA